MTPRHIPASSVNFPNMKLALAKSVKALAETGHNVVVDILFTGQKTYAELLTELNGLNVVFVTVECSLDELERRELARGDRRPGLAASQFESTHKDVQYQLSVNTQINSASECAKIILESLKASTV